MKRCKYPACNVIAKTSWALVPLCDGHQETIRWETLKFYRGGSRVQERPHYDKIVHLTPWKVRNTVQS